MRSFATLLLAAAVPALVSAANLTVNVGLNGKLAYDPPSMNASIGDTISFVFQSKNHSVYASTFANPCTSSGFTSEFFPVNATAGPFPAFMINVTQPAPIWFFCAQTSPLDHCKAGMVGVINPTGEKTLAQFQANAMGNSTSSAAGSATGTAAPSSSTSAKPNSAVKKNGSAALLTLVGVVAGLTAL